MKIVTSAGGRNEDQRSAFARSFAAGHRGSLHRPAVRPEIAGRGWRRRLKDRAKLGMRRLFELGQRLGVDVLPRHFYSQIPDIGELRSDESWKAAEPHRRAGRRTLVAVRLRRDLLLRGGWSPGSLGRHPFPSLPHEWRARIGALTPSSSIASSGRSSRGRIVQVGCGVSTAVMLLAAEEAGYRPELVCVEPFPTAFLGRLAAKDGSSWCGPGPRMCRWEFSRAWAMRDSSSWIPRIRSSRGAR